MTERLDYNQVAPNGVKALGGVYGYVMQSGLPAELVPRTNKTAAPVEPALLQSIDPVWLLYCEGANVMKNILRNDEPPQDLVLTEDQEISGEWLVEYSDDDGGDYLTIFEGEEAEARARDYRDALKEGRLGTRIVDAKVARSELRGRVIRFPR